MRGLPAPPFKQNKKPLHSLLLSTTVFLFINGLSVIISLYIIGLSGYITLPNLERNFLFLTFTFVSYAVEGSYYIYIFLTTHIRYAIEIIISNSLEC